MRKDKLSSFQAKKQKLLKIKKIIENGIEENKKIPPQDLFMKDLNQADCITKIWQIVKNEK